MSKQEKAGAKERSEECFSDLGEAALALERELRRFEEIATSVRRMSLDTRKAIERAAKATSEAAEGQERVGVLIGALTAAIAAAHERHVTNVAALQARGDQIRARGEVLASLYERYSALTEQASVINQHVQDVAAKQREATTPDRMREVVAALEGVEASMGNVVDGARDVGKDAVAAGLTDVAAQADALKQQLAAARNKVGLVRKGLEAKLAELATLN